MSAGLLGMVVVAAPLAVAVCLILLPRVRHAGMPAAMASMLGAFVSFAASTALLVQRLLDPAYGAVEQVEWVPVDGWSMVDFGVQLDGISIPMLVVVSLVALCVQVFSLEYMREEPSADYGRYFMWHSLFLFSMQGLVVAPNLLQLFVFWELVGLCSYLLIGFYYRKPSAARAAVKAFWVTKFADMGLLIGLIVQYQVCGSFDWDAKAVHALLVAGAALPVGLLYFLAVMGKSAQFPLHIWLPDAMEGPTPVSALLHAATMVAAGVFLIVRAYPIFQADETVLLAMALVGGVTAIFAACVATAQNDIKKVLAYSTCSQLGYMIAALGAGSLMAGYFHLTTHAFFKALLFLAAGSVIHGVHTNALSEMGGLAKKMKLTTAVFVVGSLALAGLPLLSGFYSKDLVLESLFEATQHNGLYWIPFVACTAGVALTAFYMGRVIFMAFFGEPSARVAHAHEGGWAMALPLLLLAGLAVASGYGGGQLAGLWGQPYAFHVLHFTPVGLVATGLAVAGLVTAFLVYNRGVGVGLLAAAAPVGDFIRFGAVDKGFEVLYRRGMLVGAAGIAWFDRYVIDGLMNVVGAGLLRAGTQVRKLQTGRVNDYIYVLLAAVVLLAAWSQVLSSASGCSNEAVAHPESGVSPVTVAASGRGGAE